MSESTMRGMRLGAQSLETESGVSFAQRIEHTYLCPNQHESKVVFAADAEVPELWQCRKCSEQGSLVVAGKHNILDSSSDRPGRSHWEMLVERRTEKELEAILKERIAYIRARRKGGKAEV